MLPGGFSRPRLRPGRDADFGPVLPVATARGLVGRSDRLALGALGAEPVSTTGAVADGCIRAKQPTERPPGFGLLARKGTSRTAVLFSQSSGAFRSGPRAQKRQRTAAVQDASAPAAASSRFMVPMHAQNCNPMALPKVVRCSAGTKLIHAIAHFPYQLVANVGAFA